MEHVRGRPTGDFSAFFHVLVGFVFALPVLFLIIGSVYNLFGRSVAGGMAALLALYIVGVCAWLTAKEIARPA